MNRPTRPWTRSGYSDIESAERRDGEIEVRFANGDLVILAAETLGLGDPDMSVECGEHGTSLNVESPDGARREIDWMVIRAAHDPAFAEELRDQDAEESRRIGTRLKALREDGGFSQTAVAQLARMPASQLSKLERGDTDMRLSTIRSLLRVMGASFADISGPDAPEISAKELTKRAGLAGVPRNLMDRMVERFDRRNLAPAVLRAFRWSPDELRVGVPTTPRLAIPVQFKTSNAEDHLDSPLLQLAHTVSAVSAAAYDHPVRDVSPDPQAVRAEILARHGGLSLSTLLQWVWDAGIVVLPLLGSGSFTAASWVVDGRPVIVLKESRQQWVYWLFDLAHELGHFALGHVTNEAVVDVEVPWQAHADDQEQEANAYAMRLLLGDSERLLGDVRARSGTTELAQRRQFKFKVADIATEADVSAGVLAVIAAFALTDVARPQDRWGSAQNLAKDEEKRSGHEFTDREFRARIALDRLSSLDAGLLRAAALA